MSLIFKYRAKNTDGEDKDGTIEALNEKDAAQKLGTQGLYPVSIFLVTDNMICSKCGKSYDLSWKTCLKCNIPLENVVSPKTELKSTKKCPYCKGDVEMSATKCKHCGEWFGAVSTRKILIIVVVIIALVIVVRLGGCILKTYSAFTVKMAQHEEKMLVAARNTCIANLKEMAGAIQVWAIDNGKDRYDVPTMDDLIPYLKDKTAPICPAGGTYRLSTVHDGIPTCSIEGHEINDQR